MAEQLYTIPLTEAFEANDECPFCFVERKIENELLDFVLGSGSTYMESDVRDVTDKEGFCKNHFKKMFDYGNTLGSGWIIKTHYNKVNKDFNSQVKMFSPSKVSIFNKLKGNTSEENSLVNWLREFDKSCYICKRFDDTYQRYLDTFFFMYKKDDTMIKMIENSKGFCLHHLADLCELADKKLGTKEKDDFYRMVLRITSNSLSRVSDDVSWLVEKFDYKNHDADWKTSKDAVQRGMQKLHGGYPADTPHKK